MANRRNTQRTPPRRAPVDHLEQRVAEDLKQLRQDVASAIGRLDNQLAIFERAFISLAQDVEYISAILDREGLLEDTGPEPTEEAHYPMPEGVHGIDGPEDDYDELTEQIRLAEEGPEETPEEEAARLIREAEAANETTVEEYNQ